MKYEMAILPRAASALLSSPVNLFRNQFRSFVASEGLALKGPCARTRIASLLPGPCLLPALLAIALLAGLASAQAQPIIVSTAPPAGATGVPPTSPLRIAFSEAMDPTTLTFMAIDMNAGGQMLTVATAWSGENTVLTCTPTAPWPASHMIYWVVDCQNPLGAPLGGTTDGMFTVGGGGTGCDTNAPALSFTVAKAWSYMQDSAAAAWLNTNAPYCFVSCMSLPCPRDATGVSLQVPGGPTWNTMTVAYPGHLTFTDCSFTNQAAFETAYPAGGYAFKIQSTASNQQVTVNLPATNTLAQPPAPHLNNYPASQAINPAQPCSLAWDAMAGGTAADCIYVEVYGGVFHTPTLGVPGALNGTATSVTIPAATLQPNHDYPGAVTFYHYQLQTNGTSYLTLTYRASTTEFTLRTAGGGSPSLVLTNCGWTAGAFRFEVSCTNGQPLVSEYCTNLTTHLWQTLCSTNSPGQSVRFTDPNSAINRQTFYRVRSGP
jgi:hypothetical protein